MRHLLVPARAQRALALDAAAAAQAAAAAALAKAPQLAGAAAGMATAGGTLTVTGAPPPPPPAGGNLWEITALPNNITLKNHAGGNIITGTSAQFNSPYVSKHTRGGYRSATGRLYWGMGDHSGQGGRNVDGFTDVTQDSANPLLYSMDPATPNILTREIGSYPNDNTRWIVAADEGGADYDSSADRLIVCPLNSFGYYKSTPLAGTPEYLSATSFRLNGSGDITAQVQAGYRIRIVINHATVGVYSFFARITSSSHSGGNTTVNFTPEPGQDITFQSPTAAYIARDDSPYPQNSAYDMAVGAGSEVNVKQGHYKESTGFWYTRLAALNFSTRDWTPLDFRAIGATPSLLAGRAHKNMVFVPASATAGRGSELHALSGFSGFGRGAVIYNLNAMTIEFVGVSFDFEGQGVQQSQMAFDGTHCYILCIYTGKLWRWTPASKSAATLADPLLDSTGQPVVQLTPNVGPDSTHCVWNSDVGAIEIYTPKAADGGVPHLYLCDPAASPLRAIKVGSADSAGNALHGMPARAGSRTLLIGDLSPGNDPPRVQAFVGGNLAWESVNHGQSYWKGFFTPSTYHTRDSTELTLGAFCPSPLYGGTAMSVDGGGNNTGKVCFRLGGDGDYFGNEVHILRLDQFSDGVVPAQTNLIASTPNNPDRLLWANEIHGSTQPGGTAMQPHVLAQKGGPYNIWQPSAIHGMSMMAYLPSLGYIESHRGAPGNVVTPETNTQTWYPGQTDPLEFGPSCHGMIGQQGIISWADFATDSGATPAGRWRTRTPDTSPLVGGSNFTAVADYNASTGKILLLFGTNGAQTAVFEWDGSFALPASVHGSVTVNVAGLGTCGLVSDSGSFSGTVWWLEGSLYIGQNSYSVLPGNARFWWTWDRAAPAAGTSLRGVSAVLDNAIYATIAIDRPSRRIFWLVVPAGSAPIANNAYPFRLYRSNFDAPAVLTEVPVRHRNAMSNPWVSLVGEWKIVFVYGGYLWLINRPQGANAGGGIAPALQIRRLPVF